MSLVGAGSVPIDCDRYYQNDNTTYFISFGGYQGIPQALVLNLFSYIVLASL